MSGHGWVTPNLDGSKARCGGPAICPSCAVELARQRQPGLRWPVPAPHGGEQIRSVPYVAALVHYVSHGTPVRPDGSQAFKSVCRAAIVAEVDDGDVPEHGVPYVTLCVLNPSGIFFQPQMLYDPGTFTGPEREAVMGEPLPLITCDDLTFGAGTWHWAGHA